MTEEPLFSIVVPTRDRTDLLREAIGSLLKQTVDDFECIVVDDGSRQPMPLMSDDRIRVVRRDRSGGPAAARNTGLDAARGRYVTFLDDDDTYAPERLADCLPLLLRSPVVVCWRNGGERVLDGDVRDVILEDLVPHLGQVSMWSTIVPRFDERFPASEDVEWWLRVARGHPVVTVPRVGYIYRTHSGPRNAIGPAQRSVGLQMLLKDEGDYFTLHPRARAFQWRQIGLAELRAGNSHTARKAFFASIRARPSIRGIWHLVRACSQMGSRDG